MKQNVRALITRLISPEFESVEETEDLVEGAFFSSRTNSESLLPFLLHRFQKHVAIADHNVLFICCYRRPCSLIPHYPLMLMCDTYHATFRCRRTCSSCFCENGIKTGSPGYRQRGEPAFQERSDDLLPDLKLQCRSFC